MRRLYYALVPALVATVVGGQAPRRATVGPPTATSTQEFSRIANMRELSDGRLLVTDFNEQSITVVDFKSNAAKVIGRKGDGPGEYALVTRLFPFGGDTTLMPFEMAMRWTVITPDLKLSTMPVDVPIVTFIRTDLVAGVDNSGHVLTHGMPRRGPGIGRDTSPLLLVDRRSMKVDTIARTDGGEAPRMQSPSDRPVFRPFMGYDHAVMSADGWVAIVRHSPYRVEWRSPDARPGNGASLSRTSESAGRWIIGKPVGDPPVPFNGAEKKAFMDRRAAARANASTKRISAPGSGMIKEGSSMPEPLFEFPDFIPFASPSPPLISTQGWLLVQRNPTAANPELLFDVFDRQGNRSFQLTFPKTQAPFAFGASSIYVVNTDDDGIQRISRHAWPVRPK